MKAIKENWKLVLIVAAGIVAVIFMCIFGVQGAQNKAFALEEQVNTMALARNILEPYLPNYEIKPYLIILHFTKIAPLTKLLIIWKAIGNYGYSGRFG